MSGDKRAPIAPTEEVKRFEWDIEWNKFDEDNLDDGLVLSQIKSDSFSIGMDNTKSSWSLALQRLDTEDDIKYLLSLVPDPENPTNVDIKFKVGVITKDGREAKVKQCQIFSGTAVWGYPAFLGEYVHLNPTFYRDGKLTIFCDLDMGRKIRIPESALDRIFDSGKFSDVTLVVGEKEFKAHRMMLATSSPVFEAMFEENQSSRVEIKDLGVAEMKGLLEFIYSGGVKDLEGIVKEVLSAANKYGVDELRTLCEKTICNKLTVKNAPSFLVFADIYSAQYLRAEALEFITKNSAKVVEEPGFHDEFAKEHPEIYKEIFNSFAGNSVKEPKEKRIKLN